MNDSHVIDTSALAVISRSEIDQQIATAKNYPRDISRSLERCESLVTRNESTAVSCLYALPRGGKLLEDASVRFAELLLSQWGNARAIARILDVGERSVRGQGVFHDLESNIAICREIERKIIGRDGKRYSEDMITMTGNACSMIAFRNAVLCGIPKALWQDVYVSARDVAGGPPAEFEERRRKMLDFFESKGYSPARLLSYISQTTGQPVTKVEYITRSHLILLRAFANSLKDIEQEQPQEEEQKQDINDAIAEKQKEAQQDEPAPRKKRKYTRRKKPVEEQKVDSTEQQQAQEVELKEKTQESAGEKPSLELIQSAFDNCEEKEHISNIIESLTKYVFSDEEQDKIDELAQETIARIEYASVYPNKGDEQLVGYTDVNSNNETPF